MKNPLMLMPVAVLVFMTIAAMVMVNDYRRDQKFLAEHRTEMRLLVDQYMAGKPVEFGKVRIPRASPNESWRMYRRENIITQEEYRALREATVTDLYQRPEQQK